MNWRRGVIRGWIAVSFIWIVLIAVATFISWPTPQLVYPDPPTEQQLAAEQNACADARTKNPSLGNMFDCFNDAPPADPTPTLQAPDSATINDHIEVFSSIAFVPPAVLLFLLSMGLWVVRGFRR